jgi:hypothetical protein
LNRPWGGKAALIPALDGKWSASAGRLEPLPKVVRGFGQEFPAALQQRERENNAPPGTKARIFSAEVRSILIANGGMRFTFPPYGYYVPFITSLNPKLTCDLAPGDG